MSCYYSASRDMLVLKCDSCKKTVDLFKGQTDKLLKHDWIRENGWKTMKKNDKWLDICEECKKALEEKKRQEWIAKS